MLDCLESHKPWNGNFHCVCVSLNHVLFSQFVGFGNCEKNVCQEVDLIYQEFWTKESFDNKFPVDQSCDIFDEFLIFFSGNFPKVNSCGKKSAKPLFYRIKCISVRSKVESLNFGEIGVLKFLKDIHGRNHEFDRPITKGIENVQNFLKSCAISFLDGKIFEIIDKFLFRSCVFKFVQNQFHVDVQKVRKRFQDNQQTFFVNDFEGFFEMGFH